MVQTLAILGSTGSIGTQTLEVCRELGITVTGLSCGTNVERLKRQILEFMPRVVSVAHAEDAEALSSWLTSEAAKREGLTRAPEVCHGQVGNCTVASLDGTDMVLAAMVGMAGLEPVLAAIDSGHDIALANKETLVAGGDLVMRRVEARGVRLHPVDSEHSAIWQCLAASTRPRDELDHLLLTASGGPFRGRVRAELEHVTREEALAHPTWSMGGKISIDSATLMNKGLELIEAVRLFDVPAASVHIVVHPESIVHSGVAYRDGAILAQLSEPDMKLPIRLALTWPERAASSVTFWDPLAGGGTRLTFEAPDTVTFRAPRLARAAVEAGGVYPIVLNAANEVAVEAFLDDRLSFLGITETVERVLDAVDTTDAPEDLAAILAIDQAARRDTKRMIGSRGMV